MRNLKRHLPILLTAVLVAGLSASGPAATRAVYDPVNAATMVHGRHAVASSSTVANRAGNVVATKAEGVLPNNTVDTAPNSAKLSGLAPSAFAPNFLYATDGVDMRNGPFCQTASVTPTRGSYAVIRVDADIYGDASTGTTFGVLPGYSTNQGRSYSDTLPKTGWNIAKAAPNSYNSAGATGVVRLAAGQRYRFAGKWLHFNDNPGQGDCSLLVEVIPRFTGSRIIAP